MFALISFNYYVRLNVEIYRERQKYIFKGNKTTTRKNKTKKYKYMYEKNREINYDRWRLYRGFGVKREKGLG